MNGREKKKQKSMKKRNKKTFTRCNVIITNVSDEHERKGPAGPFLVHSTHSHTLAALASVHTKKKAEKEAKNRRKHKKAPTGAHTV